MGSKNLKAVAALRSKADFTVYDPDRLNRKYEEMVEAAKKLARSKWGTGGGFSTQHEKGSLPVKNYTTNIYPEHEKMNGQYMRTHFKIRSRPCYKCAIAHVKEVTVTEGPYTGYVGEEPEYELLAAFGPQIGNTDLGAVVMLANEVGEETDIPAPDSQSPTVQRPDQPDPDVVTFWTKDDSGERRSLRTRLVERNK